MSKRAATRQITQDNGLSDESEPEIDQIQTAAPDVLAKRKIAVPRARKNIASSTSSNPFSGLGKPAAGGAFAGLSKPNASVASTTTSTTASNVASNVASNAASTTASKTDLKLAGLNKSFSAKIELALKQSPIGDFSEACKQYIAYATKIKSENDDIPSIFKNPPPPPSREGEKEVIKETKAEITSTGFKFHGNTDSTTFKFGDKQVDLKKTASNDKPGGGFVFNPNGKGEIKSAKSEEKSMNTDKEAPKFSFGKPAESAPTTDAPSAPKFSFGKPAESAPTDAPKFSFGKPAESAPTDAPKFSFGKPAESAPTDAPKFSFGKPAESAPTEKAPAEKAPAEKAPADAPSAPKFSFGKPAESAPTDAPKFSFGKPADSDTPKFSFGKPAEGAPTNAPKFSFGKPEESAPTDSTDKSTSSAPKFSFGKPAEPSSGSKFSFGTGENPFGSKPAWKPEDGVKIVTKPSESGENNDEEDKTNDVQTDLTGPGPGEEDEDVVYEKKSKAFNLVDGALKPMGLGFIRVLVHKETKKARLLMRADPSGRVLLNIPIRKPFTYPCNQKTVRVLEVKPGDDAPTPYTLMVKTPEDAKALSEKLEEVRT